MADGDRGGTHPSPTELDGFLLGNLSPHRAASVVVHLVRGCALCREEMAPLASVLFASGPLAPPAAPESSSEYDFPLFRAFAAARRIAETYRQEAASVARQRRNALLKEVPALDDVPAAAVRETRGYCEALLDRCISLRYDDPEAMVLAASLAVVFAERMDTDQGEPASRADLQARAWAELGNAHRVADDLSSAEAALAHALKLSGRGTGDALLLARIMDLTASLYTDRRRFAEAHRLLDWVYTIYRNAGETHLAARALISKGISVGLAFESEEAVKLLQQGIRLMDPARDPKLTFSAVQGLLGFLVDCGRATEVRDLWHEARKFLGAFPERFVKVRARWLEGRIAAALGEDVRAEQAFLEVRESFRGAGQPYDMALVSLHLAAVWLRQGRTAEIKEAVDEMVAIFRSRNIRREAIGAMLMLREALQRDQATAALLQAVAAELGRLERFPV
jgi:tetratricopeptide (TPR) repeat protein